MPIYETIVLLKVSAEKIRLCCQNSRLLFAFWVVCSNWFTGKLFQFGTVSFQVPVWSVSIFMKESVCYDFSAKQSDKNY